MTWYQVRHVHGKGGGMKAETVFASRSLPSAVKKAAALVIGLPC